MTMYFLKGVVEDRGKNESKLSHPGSPAFVLDTGPSVCVRARSREPERGGVSKGMEKGTSCLHLEEPAGAQGAG